MSPAPRKKPKSRTSRDPRSPRIDTKALRTIDHECIGCGDIETNCCARYDVCVTGAELKRILLFMPEAAKFCPGLKEGNGYANVFDDAEKGLHSIETHENSLCVFAFRKKGLIRCSLHAVELDHGWPLGTVKPKMCVLWPLTYAEDGKTLTLHDGAFDCVGSSRRKRPSKRISPAFEETIAIMTGNNDR